MKKKLLAAVALICIAVAIVMLWRVYSILQHETTIVSRGLAVQSVYATGTVEPVFWSKVSPAIAGKVAKIYVKEGQRVQEGELLVGLEDRVERALLTELQARLDYLDKEVERHRKLRARDIVSIRTFQKTLSEHNKTTALTRAQEQLLKRMVVSSPMDGVILRRDIEPGEYIKAGEVIMWVGLKTPLRITADVDEEDIPLVKIGQRVLIKADAFPEEVSEGTVAKITPKGDPVTKNFRVRIALPDDTKFLIGMTAEINIITEQRPDALLIPKTSVINGNVWVVRNSTINKTPVKVGIVGEEKVQILEGLREGEKVLLKPSKSKL